MVLAAFLFMRRMAEESTVSMLGREFDESDDEGERDPNSVRRREVPPGVEIYEINGPFFLGAAEKFKETIADHSTGLNALRDVVVRFRRAGTRVILSDVHAQPMLALQRSSLADELPEDDLVGNIDDALNVARAHLGLAPVARAAFATPTVAREDRRRQPRPPG